MREFERLIAPFHARINRDSSLIDAIKACIHEDDPDTDATPLHAYAQWAIHHPEIASPLPDGERLYCFRAWIADFAERVRSAKWFYWDDAMKIGTFRKEDLISRPARTATRAATHDLRRTMSPKIQAQMYPSMLRFTAADLKCRTIRLIGQPRQADPQSPG